MKQFEEYINGSAPMNRVQLEEIVQRYPWFTTARIALARASGEVDALLKLYLFTHPTPKPFLENISSGDFLRPSTEDIIDAFLVSGEHRIVPQEYSSDYGAEQEVFTADDDIDFVTEELAEIYLNQGHLKQAKEIYERLSLLYPKKSVYFAEIIARIDSQ